MCHSFRRGTATGLAHINAPSYVAKGIGIWGSDAYLGYVDATESGAMLLPASSLTRNTRNTATVLQRRLLGGSLASPGISKIPKDPIFSKKIVGVFIGIKSSFVCTRRKVESALAAAEVAKVELPLAQNSKVVIISTSPCSNITAVSIRTPLLSYRLFPA